MWSANFSWAGCRPMVQANLEHVRQPRHHGFYPFNTRELNRPGHCAKVVTREDVRNFSSPTYRFEADGQSSSSTPNRCVTTAPDMKTTPPGLLPCWEVGCSPIGSSMLVRVSFWVGILQQSAHRLLDIDVRSMRPFPPCRNMQTKNSIIS